MLVELAVNDVPVIASHCFAPIIYTALYGLFATFKHAVAVVYDGKRGWPYFFTDVDKLGLSVSFWTLRC